MTGTSSKHLTISRGNRCTTFRSVDTRTGIRTRSDQSLTSGAFPSAVRVSPRGGKVVRPCGSQPGSHPNTAPGIVTPWCSSPRADLLPVTWPRVCPTQTPPSNPIAAKPGDGRVPSRPSWRVHEPCSSPEAVALRSQTVLTGPGSHGSSYGGFGGGHPHFHPHTGRRQPSLGYRTGGCRVLLAARVWPSRNGGPGMSSRAGLTKGQRTSCGGVITQGAQLPGSGVRCGSPVTEASKTPLACRPVGTLVPSRVIILPGPSLLGRCS